MSTKTPVFGGYCRISSDPKDKRLGVDRQREDIRKAVAEASGDPDAIVWFEENDTSAYRKRKVSITENIDGEQRERTGWRVVRPVWNSALHALRTGTVSTLVVYDLDRLARDPRDLEDALEAVEHYGARVVSATASAMDLATDTGKLSARINIAVANKSSADTARRVKRALEKQAQSGLPSRSSRPFGWQAGGVELDMKEAERIRAAARDLIDGASIKAIARGWNEDGVTTSRGNKWSSLTLRQMLKSPRLAGWRVHHGEVAVGEDGQPVRGQWTPIITDAEHAALVARLSAPDNRSRVPRRDARRYLLTGTVRCGVCGGLMYANGAHTSQIYVCSGDHRPTLAISGRSLDEFVGAEVVARLADEAMTVPAVEFTGADELADVEERIKELSDGFAAGTISGSVFMPTVGKLDERRSELRRERREAEADAARSHVADIDPGAWEDTPTDRRRAVVEALLEAVIVKRIAKRSNRFQPERVELVWRG